MSSERSLCDGTLLSPLSSDEYHLELPALLPCYPPSRTKSSLRQAHDLKGDER